MRIRWYVAIVVTAIAVLAGLVLLVVRGYEIDGTGFGKYDDPNTTEVDRQAKTLWDWMDLLLVPVILAIGGIIYSIVERRSERATQKQRRQDDLDIQAQRDKTERDIAFDRQRENALQAYLDRMTELLLEEGLRTSDENAEVRDVARARTLAVLRGLDAGRKGLLVQFLKESKLIQKSAGIVDLRSADLKGADLKGANLRSVDLTLADLSCASLRGANLLGAKLLNATLINADMSSPDWLRITWLRDADLTQAVLTRANLSGAELKDADLKGADLVNATLIGADLKGADLRSAKLIEADLSHADLSEANMLGTIYNKATIWPDRFDPKETGATLVSDKVAQALATKSAMSATCE